MKKRILSMLIAAIMCCVLSMSLCACEKEQVATKDEATVATQALTEAIDPLWENATYKEDTTLGQGKVAIDVEVEAGEKSVTFTINTDATNLEDALTSVSLVEGETSEFGLYIKKVNGIVADYDTDKAYWSINKDGEYLVSGAADTAIANGEHYELVYTK